MTKLGKIFVFVVCLICSGCGKAQTSEARKDHILSGDHGWLDLTLAHGARIEGQKAGSSCELTLTLNGEPFLNEFVDVAKLGDNEPAVGYRFPAPVGNLQAELTVGSCVKTSYAVKLPVNLVKNNLASVRFDGAALSLQGLSPYDPPTLDRVRSDIATAHASEEANEQTLATVKWIAVAILAINVFVALVLLRKRK